MQVSNSFKKDFLRKLLLGLQHCGIPSKSMSLLERKRAIKLSSDVALAATRDRGAQWSRALIANLSKQEPNKTFVRNMLGKEFDRLTNPSHSPLTCKKVQSRSILKRSCLMRRMRKTAAKGTVRATTLAKRMQKKRTQILKALVPGGQYMDELSSLEEMVDYILYLKAQVDVMRYLANAFEQPSSK
ncbi:transcription factor IBH1-like 1 [Aristolochia californica]|uniref:transcription factor IBH1-like 1 n=1 Tax=Aristolochia californica TaxID=171875 RepID=UPI0035D7BF35